MGIIARTVNTLYRTSRGFESLSIRIGAGQFNNTDKRICKECLQAGLQNDELCQDCKLVWLLELEYPRRFTIFLSAVCGLSWIAVGSAAFWGNWFGNWWRRSNAAYSIVEIVIASAPSNFLASSVPEAYNTPLSLSMLFILLSSLVLAVATSTASMLPRLLNPKAKRNKVPRWQLVYMWVTGLSVLSGSSFGDIGEEELGAVVIPLTIGFQVLSVLAIWVGFGLGSEDRVGAGVGAAEKSDAPEKIG